MIQRVRVKIKKLDGFDNQSKIRRIRDQKNTLEINMIFEISFNFLGKKNYVLNWVFIYI